MVLHRTKSSQLVIDADGPDAVLTVAELAVLLRVNRKSVYAAIARGEIPGAFRVGHRVRVSRVAVDAWLAEGQRP